MIESQVSKCAAPFCKNQWHKMSEGKLFVFHVKREPSQLRELRNVWLCEACFDSWDVNLDENGNVLLCPLERMAA